MHFKPYDKPAKIIGTLLRRQYHKYTLNTSSEQASEGATQWAVLIQQTRTNLLL